MGGNVARSFGGKNAAKARSRRQWVQFGCDFVESAIAAVRTYKARPEAMSHLIPGQQWNELNYSIHRKRVLNMEREVTAADNVKQRDRTHKVL